MQTTNRRDEMITLYNAIRDTYEVVPREQLTTRLPIKSTVNPLTKVLKDEVIDSKGLVYRDDEIVGTALNTKEYTPIIKHTITRPKDTKEIDNTTPTNTVLERRIRRLKKWAGIDLHTLVERTKQQERLFKGRLRRYHAHTKKDIEDVSKEQQRLDRAGAKANKYTPTKYYITRGYTSKEQELIDTYLLTKDITKVAPPKEGVTITAGGSLIATSLDTFGVAPSTVAVPHYNEDTQELTWSSAWGELIPLATQTFLEEYVVKNSPDFRAELNEIRREGRSERAKAKKSKRKVSLNTNDKLRLLRNRVIS
jgi:hypothetical protein